MLQPLPKLPHRIFNPSQLRAVWCWKKEEPMMIIVKSGGEKVINGRKNRNRENGVGHEFGKKNLVYSYHINLRQGPPWRKLPIHLRETSSNSKFACLPSFAHCLPHYSRVKGEEKNDNNGNPTWSHVSDVIESLIDVSFRSTYKNFSCHVASELVRTFKVRFAHRASKQQNQGFDQGFGIANHYS